MANPSEAQQIAFNVYRKAAAKCPAYKHFYSTKHFKAPNPLYFNQIPISDKDSYYRQYPLEKKIFSHHQPSDFYMYCTSSGTTGEPTIWPRDLNTDKKIEELHTNLLDKHFSALSKKTLIVINYGLGSSTAGMLHAKLSWEMARHGNITVTTPGTDAERTIFLINNLYQYFDQVISIGYPPFISEFIDLAVNNNLRVRDWNLNILFSSENVSIQWREKIANIINGNKSISNIIAYYACSEIGIIGVESSVTNRILSLFMSHPALMYETVQAKTLPSIVEINQQKIFIEIIDNEIVITVDQLLPLVRYNTHDFGKLVTGSYIKKAIKSRGLQSNFINDKAQFLVIYGRNRGLVVPVDTIRVILEKSPLSKQLSTEFQYNEAVNNGQLTISLQVYLKANALVNLDTKRKFNKHLSRSLSKLTGYDHTNLTVKIKKPLDKIGYKSGKIVYDVPR